jgi:transcriptional regulator with XRE-family HTH domain
VRGKRHPLRKSKAFEKEFARFQTNLGKVVGRLRRKAGLSRAELARRANLGVSTLAHIEQGKGNPLLSRMENLAFALKHRLSYILRLAQDMDEDK